MSRPNKVTFCLDRLIYGDGRIEYVTRSHTISYLPFLVESTEVEGTFNTEKDGRDHLKQLKDGHSAATVISETRIGGEYNDSR